MYDYHILCLYNNHSEKIQYGEYLLKEEGVGVLPRMGVLPHLTLILQWYISNNSNDLIGSIFAAAKLCIMLLVAAMTNHISNSNEFSWALFDHTN